MAGYSRTFRTAFLSSVGIFAIFWLFKRKDTLSKLRVTTQLNSSSYCVEQQQSAGSMKVKEEQPTTEVECVEMQILEQEMATPRDEGCSSPNHTNGIASSQNLKNKANKRSKKAVKGNTCLSQKVTTNGCTKDNTSQENGDSEVKLSNGDSEVKTNGLKELVSHNGFSDVVSPKEVLDKNCSTLMVDSDSSNGKSDHTSGIDESSEEDSHNEKNQENGFHIEQTIQLVINTEQSDPEDSPLSPLSDLSTTGNCDITLDNRLMNDSLMFEEQSVSESTAEVSSELEPLFVNEVSNGFASLSVVASDEQSTVQSSSIVTEDHSIIVNGNAPILTFAPIGDASYSFDPSMPINYVETNEYMTVPEGYIASEVPVEDLQVCPEGAQGESVVEIPLVQSPMVYSFEILPEDCGRLIGRNGKYVKFINKESRVEIIIKKHPVANANGKKLCTIAGAEEDINYALDLIRKRFPIEDFPDLTLAEVSPYPLIPPGALQLPLLEGGTFQAMICCTMNPGHFFLQQPTHPSYHQLAPFCDMLTQFYDAHDAPMVNNPSLGNICVTHTVAGWFRAQIVEVFADTEECRVKFLDYGGYVNAPNTSIRQIWGDFFTYPFQATECYLAGVEPADGNEWSEEALAFFESLSLGPLLQGCIIGYSPDKIPYVNLYKFTGSSSIFINHELINANFAKAVEMDYHGH